MVPSRHNSGSIPARLFCALLLAICCSAVGGVLLHAQERSATVDSAQSRPRGYNDPEPYRTNGGPDFVMMPFGDYQKVYSQTYTHTELSSGTPPEKKLYVTESPANNYCADDTIKQAFLNARLKMGPNDYTFDHTDFNVTVRLRITAFKHTPGDTVDYLCTLKIISVNGDVKPEQLYRKEFTDIYPEVDSFRVSVLGYTPTFNVAAQTKLRDSLRLEVYYTEEFKKKAANAAAATTPNLQIVELGISGVVSSKTVTLQWNLTAECANDSFPNYQVQLLRLFNRDASKSPTVETDIRDTVDWRRAFTFETGNGNKEVTLTIAEGTGYYIWRVRPIGDWYPGGIANDRNWGVWSASPSQGAELNITTPSRAGVHDTLKPIFFFNQFDRDKNWIYKRNLSEGSEGTRISEAMTYATNLLQVRQSQAHMQSKDSMLVSQSVLDFSGRPALASLPAPVAWDGFGYKNQFLPQSGVPYTAEDFDDDGKLLAPDALTSGTLSDYYSDNNTDLRIANADGYAFMRTLFYPDPTGRVREQGGAGETHRLKSGSSSRTIKAFYSQASDDELIAMFGDEAPSAEGVQKVTRFDPNGIGTVQYISKEGQSIATALVRFNASNPALQELNETTIFDQTVKQRMSARTPYGEYGAIGSSVIMLQEPGEIALKYTVTPKEIELECASYCAVCDYKIQIAVFPLADPSSPSFTYTKILTPASCGGSHTFSIDTTVPDLQAGTYFISRTISANNEDGNGRLYRENHMRAVDSIVRYQASVKLAPINGYLDTFNLKGLYTYLDGEVTAGRATVGIDPETGDTAYTVTTDCCTLKVPKKHCLESPCGTTPAGSFEKLLYDTWGEGSYAYNGDPDKHYGNTLDKYFYTGLSTPLFPHHATYNPGGKGAFDSLITHMIRDGYDCAALWQIWQGVVLSFGRMSADNPDTDPGNPDDRKAKFNLLEEFLRRAGRMFEGISNCTYGDCGYGKGYLDHAHRFFLYTSDANTQDCRDLLNNGNDLLSGGVPVNPWDADLLTESPEEKEWERFYSCIYSQQNPPPADQRPEIPIECDPPGSEECVLALKQAAEDTCRTRCMDRLFGFQTSLVQAYHDAGKIVERDRFTLDGLPLDSVGYILDSLGNRTDSIVPWVTWREIECQTSMLIGQCEDLCTLTVVRDSVNTIQRVGTDTEITAFRKAMYYTWKIDVSGAPCPDGYDLITDTKKSASYLRILLNHLNRALRDLRRITNDNITADSVARHMWNVFSAYTGSTGCRWADTVTSDSLGDGCLPPIGRPGIFTLGENISSEFVADDSCRLIFVRRMVIDGVLLTQRDTLCANICFDSCTAAPLCFKWLDLEAPDTNVIMRPFTCEELMSRMIRGSLGYQIDKCVNRKRAEIAAEYKLQCGTPENINDSLSIEYALALYHFTLYYYDRAGNLVRTVPPKGVTLAPNRSTHPSHGYVTSYEYNSIGQLVRQRTPDGGTSQMWYDAKGQLRFTQSAEQGARNAFSFTKYDPLGRVIETGESIYTVVADLANNADDSGYPLTNRNNVYRTVYTNSTPGTYLAEVGRTQRYLRNRVSYTVNGDSSVATTYSYDPHGNVEWIIQYINGLGANYVRYEYDLISGNLLALLYNEGLGDQLTQRYAYDEDNRLTKVESSRDGAIWDRDASYHYYLHGPLRRIEYGEDSLQGVDYTYTLQGWIKGINHPKLSTTTTGNDPGHDGDAATNLHAKYAPDAFGMILSYYEGDFKRKSGMNHSPFNSGGGSAGYTVPSENLNGSTDLYNGNISAWASNTIPAGGGQIYEKLTGERYIYDRLNRLVESDFTHYSPVQGWVTTGDYDTRYTYDPNGNILTLVRHGATAGSHLLMDSLFYTYTPTTNRLRYVDDGVAPGLPSTDIEDQNPANYDYDASGRLKSDVQEGITGMTWTPYNKVREVSKNAGGFKLRFTYDAMGNRVRKSVIAGNSGTTTYYVREAGGKVIAIYTKPCLDLEEAGDGTMGPDRCADPNAAADGDRDGIPDSQDNAPLTFNPDQQDTDGDGLGDVIEWDIDNDGIANLSDPCVFDPLNSCTGDADSDGIADGSDPCPTWPGNGGGSDRDSDGTPDGCDIDLDGDGVWNNEDNCPWKYNPMQEDTNDNQIGDSCECGLGGGPSYGSCGITLGEQYVYGHSYEGRILTIFPNRARDMESHAADTIFTRVTQEKEYELNDHLGNLRVRFSDLKKNNGVVGGAPFKVDLRGYVNYYPFGMAHPGREMDMGGYRYGYNGMEMDNEWNNRQGVGGNVGTGNSYDFGARIYNPRLSRWMSIDPLFKVYNGVAPYIGMGNNPVYYIDTDGRKLEIGGNVEIAEQDVRSLVPDYYQGAISISTSGEVSFDLSRVNADVIGLAPRGTLAGVELLQRLINSEKKYIYEATEIVEFRNRNTNAVVRTLLSDKSSAAAIANLSTTPFGKLLDGTWLFGSPEATNTALPRDGYDGQVAINPHATFYEEVDIGGILIIQNKPRASIVFHELSENYYRTEAQLPYQYYRRDEKRNTEEEIDSPPGAHEKAIEDEDRFHKRSINPGRANSNYH